MINLHPKFQEILNTDKRYIVVTGGRGSAKSFGVGTIMVLTSYEKGHVILYTRYAMTTADDSIIPEVNEKIELLEAPHHFSVYKDSITNNQSGSIIKFRGIKTTSGDQTAKLKSLTGLTDWVLDEAEELTDEKKFDDIDLSIRAKTAQNRIILILNPTDREHWIWKRWFAGHLSYITIDGEQIPVSNHPDILHLHFTYLDNLEHLPPDFVESLRRMKIENPKKYKYKILGGWLEKAEGVIFDNWTEGEFDTYLPYCYGLDFGYSPDPCAMVKVAVDRRKKLIYWKEVLYSPKLSTKDAVKSVKAAVDHKMDLIVCDTSEPRLYAELKANGLNVTMAQKKGKMGKSVVTDIRDIQDYQIVIDPYSYNLKREINSYRWNDKKADIPMDVDNHGMDAGRYGFRRLVPYQKGKGMRRIN